MLFNYRTSQRALLAESDQGGRAPGHHGRVSIHALLAESDDLATLKWDQIDLFQSTPSLRRATPGPLIHLITVNDGFNPRPPCGERQLPVRTDFHAGSFNPRPPCGERPPVPGCCPSDGMFQSTPSLRRATEPSRTRSSQGRSFNPRPPCGERLPQRYMLLINHASGASRQLHEDGTSHTVFSSSCLNVNLRFPMSYKNRRPPGNLM